MVSSRSSHFFFLILLWSPTERTRSALFSRAEPALSQKEDDLVVLDDNPLDVLGKEDVTTLKSSWGLTVNDQCLYEFVYQFEHNPDLPLGEDLFEGNCTFGTLKEPLEPINATDGLPYLQPRRFYERFPKYVGVTMGFDHLSVDWLPCGRRPKGYKTAQYDLSFFRVSPEYRAQTMVCKLQDTKTVTIVPGQEFCDTNQEDPKGMNFFIVPGAMMNRNPVLNMPFDFTHKNLGTGPLPHIGLRAWNDGKVPETPSEWNDVPIFMSSYAGKLAMWQAHIPYKMIKGEDRQFHSNADRYFETTIQTLPDTWSVKYDERNGKIRFTIVGKAEICRGEFERAQKAARGPKVFPNYDYRPTDSDSPGNSTGSGTKDSDGDGDGDTSGSNNSSFRTTIFNTMILQISMLIFALTR